MRHALNVRRQAGNSLYIVLSLLVLIGIALVVYMLTQSKDADIAVLPESDQALVNAEPEPVQSVDMQNTEIQPAPTAANPSGERATATDSGSAGLFEREGRKLPLTDGLAGGTEASTATPSQSADPDRSAVKVHALDAFDFGVLDGRVRIGVFGKGPIPDYRVRLTNDYYLIDMPGEFRYIDEFSRALIIERFGVSRAQLSRSPRGIQMRIDVTPALKHQPFLIEDAKGLMIAFEPQRGL